MQTNIEVEVVAQKLRQIVPDFTVGQSYTSAYEIIELLKDISTPSISEPTA